MSAVIYGRDLWKWHCSSRMNFKLFRTIHAIKAEKINGERILAQSFHRRMYMCEMCKCAWVNPHTHQMWHRQSPATEIGTTASCVPVLFCAVRHFLAHTLFPFAVCNACVRKWIFPMSRSHRISFNFIWFNVNVAIHFNRRMDCVFASDIHSHHSAWLNIEYYQHRCRCMLIF